MSELANDKPRFRLYVVARKLTTPRTIQGVRDALTALMGDEEFQLEIFDVIANPRSAFEGQIKATPTLVRVHPLPEVRIIGDMGRPDVLIQAMGNAGYQGGKDYFSGNQ
jgi:circadian clock protein KaiB